MSGAVKPKTLRVEIGSTVIEADLDLDFFVCPTHGVLMPGRFDAAWSTDEDCPVEGCGESVQGIFLSSLFGREFDSPSTPAHKEGGK